VREGSGRVQFVDGSSQKRTTAPPANSICDSVPWQKPNGSQKSAASSSFSIVGLSRNCARTTIDSQRKYLTPAPSPNENFVSDSRSAAEKNVAPSPANAKGLRRA